MSAVERRCRFLRDGKAKREKRKGKSKRGNGNGKGKAKGKGKGKGNGKGKGKGKGNSLDAKGAKVKRQGRHVVCGYGRVGADEVNSGSTSIVES